MMSDFVVLIIDSTPSTPERNSRPEPSAPHFDSNTLPATVANSVPAHLNRDDPIVEAYIQIEKTLGEKRRVANRPHNLEVHSRV